MRRRLYVSLPAVIARVFRYVELRS